MLLYNLTVQLLKAYHSFLLSSYKHKKIFFTLLKYPITPFMTSPRIHREAVNLISRIKVLIFKKPAPIDPMTLHSQQNWIHRLRMKILDWFGAQEVE